MEAAPVAHSMTKEKQKISFIPKRLARTKSFKGVTNAVVRTDMIKRIKTSLPHVTKKLTVLTAVCHCAEHDDDNDAAACGLQFIRTAITPSTEAPRSVFNDITGDSTLSQLLCLMFISLKAQSPKAQNSSRSAKPILTPKPAAKANVARSLQTLCGICRSVISVRISNKLRKVHFTYPWTDLEGKPHMEK